MSWVEKSKKSKNQQSGWGGDYLGLESNDEHAESHDIFIPFKDKIYSKQGSHISLLFGTWTLVLFPHAGAQPEIFQGRRGFVELAHFDKNLSKTHERKTLLENILEFFSQRYR